MELMLVQYIVFIAAAFLLIWAVMLLNKRLSRRDPSHLDSLKNWVELDTKRPQKRKDLLPEHLFDDGEEEEIAELHARAHQNGHHAESQKPPF